MTRIVTLLTCWLGSPVAIIGSVIVVLAWALTGPVFGFSDTWQLVINTGTTVVTFNMCFVIQATQNRDSAAIHTKLDALIKATPGADDALTHLEDEDEAAIQAAHAAI